MFFSLDDPYVKKITDVIEQLSEKAKQLVLEHAIYILDQEDRLFEGSPEGKETLPINDEERLELQKLRAEKQKADLEANQANDA